MLNDVRLIERTLGIDEFIDLTDALLVINGPTRPGNRRARRLLVEAAALGHRVVWLDGFGERDAEGRLVPVDFGVVTPDAPVEWWDVSRQLEERLRGTVAWRNAQRLDATTRAWSGHDRFAGLVSPLSSVARSLRRLTRAMRGPMLWGLIRPHLRSEQALAAVVHTDDFSVTTAWHLARRVAADVPVMTDVPAPLVDGQAVR